MYSYIKKYDIKSRSESHKSYCNYNKQDNAIPIFVLGFGRSGTTTFQKMLSQSLLYNASFEPIGKNDTKYNNIKIKKLSILFRAAPDKNNLELYTIGGAPFSILHKVKNKLIYDELYLELKEYINHLYDFYGSNVIIKEVKIIPNTITISKINDELGIKPLFVFLKSNPFQIMHTYYRLGGLIEENDFWELRVNEIYEYRKLTYQKLGLFLDEINIDCNNKYEKLLISIILDYKYMSFLESENTINSISVNFNYAEDAINKIGNIVKSSHKTTNQNKISMFERFREDKYYIMNIQNNVKESILSILYNDLKYDCNQSLKPSNKFFVTYNIDKILNKMKAVEKLWM